MLWAKVCPSSEFYEYRNPAGKASPAPVLQLMMSNRPYRQMSWDFRKRVGLTSLLCLFTVSGPDRAYGAQEMPTAGRPAAEGVAILQDVGIQDKTGTRLPLEDLRFVNETGVAVQLKDYFGKGRPVLLNLVYYDCPHLCTLVLNGLLKTLNQAEWTVGNEFEIVSLSIDPREGPQLASQKKVAYLSQYLRTKTNPTAADQAQKGWHFLTGTEDQIRKLASAVGFNYKYDPVQKQYAHGAGIFLLTPEGKLSRTLYGIDFSSRDFRLGLLEASNGKIGSVVDRVMMFCYQYDPNSRSYSVFVRRILQVSSAFFVLLMALILGSVFLKIRSSKPSSETGSF